MAHMQPEAQRFTQDEVKEFIDMGHEYLEDAEAGWYGRLSAPGYLDASDWQGPYETGEEALKAVMNFYEVDEDGEEIEEEVEPE